VKQVSSNLTNSTKTKLLKVLRQRDTSNVYEFFEFEHLSPSKLGFDVLSLGNITDTPLWDMQSFFEDHLRDLLLQAPVSEANPLLVISRLDKPKGGE
jgi:hypothetical protein